MKQWIALLLALTMLLGVTACGRKDKTETFEAYYQEFTEEDVVYEDSEFFVDSQLLLTAVSGTKTSTIEKLIKEAGGKIVGYIEISDDYQIEFPEGKTLDELNQLVDKWSEEDFVEYVSLHNVFYMDTSAVNFETDPWLPTNRDVSADEAEWYESIPGGTNWWAEMINMPSVWSMDREFETVRVGVIDSMFNTEHEDLDDSIVKVYYNPEVLSCYHGSHVTGIIAAENNNIGITGVSQNAEIYGYAMHGKETSATSIFKWSYAISNLLSDGVKVINISMGTSLTMIAFMDRRNGMTEDTSKAIRDLVACNKLLESFLSKCLSYYDFLIIKSAGNESNDLWLENPEPTEENPYNYVYVEEKSFRVQDVPADNDAFSGIDDLDVRSHILVVGSVDLRYEDGLTPVASESIFSNADPDLYAPGGTYTSDSFKINILSTTEGTVGTEEKVGTSMATPVVTGVAALVWGVNPELTAIQVRTILTSSAASNARFPGVVDALKAVQLAEEMFKMPEDEKLNSDEHGTIMGYAFENRKNEQTGENQMEVLQNVEFALYKVDANEEYQEVGSIEVESDGSYTLFLEPGKYSITATKEGYMSHSYPFEIEAGQVRIIKLNLEKSESENYGKNSLYIPIIEGILDSDDYSEGEGFLYDTDGDGLDELILLYSVSDGMTVPKVLCTVCDIENGEVIYHIDELQVTTLAGAPEYCVGVVETVDGTAFMIYTLGYAEGGSAEEYTIYDGTDYEQIDVLWRHYYGGQYFYARHGESLSELDFEVLIDSIEFQDLMGSSYSLNIDDYRFSAMSLEELLEYLQGIEDTPSADDEPTDSNKDWKQLYYDFIVENKSDYKNETDWDYVGYQLLYLDEDDIPELWIDYAIYASGCGLTTICDDEVCFEHLASGYLEYEENNNTFLHSTGHQGMFMDTIYSIEDGKFCIASEGYYNIDRGEYYWGESNISAAAYEDIIGEFVDRSLTKNTYEDPDSVYTYEEILSYLADEDTPKSDIEQTLTEDEVLSLAQKYWDIYPGEVEDETGFAYGFMVMSYPTEDDPNYTIALRHYVEDHMSTVDMVLVNATTGECKSFW